MPAKGVLEGRDMGCPTCMYTHMHIHLYTLIHPYTHKSHCNIHNHTHTTRMLLIERKIIIA